LLTHGTDYSYDDLLYIAKGQLAMEDEYIQSTVNGPQTTVNAGSQLMARSSQLLFIDTEMYVMKVWCEFVFEKCHRWILDQIIERKYDLYLLCNTDLPWIKDELREYPDFKTRDQLYHIYKDIMINQSTPWVDINGDYDERLQKAINAVDQLMAG